MDSYKCKGFGLEVVCSDLSIPLYGFDPRRADDVKRQLRALFQFHCMDS